MLKIKYSNFILILVVFIVKNIVCYKIYSLEDDDLCSLIGKRKIYFGAEDQSGIIVTQSRLKDHSIDWKYNLHCKFQLNAKSIFRDRGIFAVIQHLSLRKNETTGECIDFIQFKYDKKQTERICDIDSVNQQFSFQSVDDVANNGIIDFDGQLDVLVYVDKQKLAPDEKMDLHIVFTAFKYAPCKDSLYYSCGSYDLCIYKEFFNDGYVNCPFENCVDEEGCTPIKHSSEVGTKVTIGATATILLGFLFFLVCLWICKKHKVLCWSSYDIQPRNAQTPPQQMDMSVVIDQRTDATEGHAPSAPSVHDIKDLPPAYDSLFPVNPNK